MGVSIHENTVFLSTQPGYYQALGIKIWLYNYYLL